MNKREEPNTMNSFFLSNNKYNELGTGPSLSLYRSGPPACDSNAKEAHPINLHDLTTKK